MPRVPHSGFVRIACSEPSEIADGAGRRQAVVWNVSVLGVYVVVDPIPPEGEQVRLTFRLPDDPTPIETDGRVAWVNPPSRVKGVATKVVDLPPGCGIEFLALADSDRARIEERVRATGVPPSTPSPGGP